ncbi:MAG: hypothetical protein ACRDD4_12175 [Culicoidibacterales bacterium]
MNEKLMIVPIQLGTVQPEQPQRKFVNHLRFLASIAAITLKR